MASLRAAQPDCHNKMAYELVDMMGVAVKER